MARSEKQAPQDYRHHVEALVTYTEQNPGVRAWIAGNPPKPVELWVLNNTEQDGAGKDIYNYGVSTIPNIGPERTERQIRQQGTVPVGRPSVRGKANHALAMPNIAALYAPVADLPLITRISEIFASSTPDHSDVSQVNKASEAIIARSLTMADDPYDVPEFTQGFAGLVEFSAPVEVDPRRKVADYLGQIVAFPEMLRPRPSDERLVTAIDKLHSVDAVDPSFWFNALASGTTAIRGYRRTAFGVEGLLKCWQDILERSPASDGPNPSIIPLYFQGLLRHLIEHDSTRSPQMLSRVISATKKNEGLFVPKFAAMINNTVLELNKNREPQDKIDPLPNKSKAEAHAHAPEALRRFLAVTQPLRELNAKLDPNAELSERDSRYVKILQLIVERALERGAPL